MPPIDARREMAVARAYVAEARAAVDAINERTPPSEAEGLRRFLVASLSYEAEIRSRLIGRSA